MPVKKIYIPHQLDKNQTRYIALRIFDIFTFLIS